MEASDHFQAPDRCTNEQVAGWGSTADTDSLKKGNIRCPGRELKHIPPPSRL